MMDDGMDALASTEEFRFLYVAYFQKEWEIETFGLIRWAIEKEKES